MSNAQANQIPTKWYDTQDEAFQNAPSQGSSAYCHIVKNEQGKFGSLSNDDPTGGTMPQGHTLVATRQPGDAMNGILQQREAASGTSGGKQTRQKAKL